jgi:hypothetical protein
MSLPLAIPIYFLAGAFKEALVVLYYKAMIKRGKQARWRASGLAGGIDAYDWIVLVTVLKSHWTVELIVAYVLGVMVGTYVTMGRD